MMQIFSTSKKYLQGDFTIWALVGLLALFSFMPVYSASTNLVYTVGTGHNTSYYLFKHFLHVIVGFVFFLWAVHRLDYKYFRSIGVFGLPIVVALLIYALTRGTTIGGANASRWVSVMGVQFQPSSLAAVILLMYVAQYLVKVKDEIGSFKASFIELWIPVFIVVGLIFPANFSTAALIFFMVCLLVFVAKYPLKYLFKVLGIGAIFVSLFVSLALLFPGSFNNRVHTWASRIERYTSNDGSQDLYQVENAKMAVALGGFFGVGPGKSVQKNFLPQSSSDFIYAIIVEEFGILVGLAVLGVYILLFIRFLIAAHKAPTLFGKLLVIGLGFLFTFQALINMGVAVSLLPTTGQTLPLISSGGTAIWMTCFSLGVILSVTKKEKEIQAHNLAQALLKEKEQEELARMEKIRLQELSQREQLEK